VASVAPCLRWLCLLLVLLPSTACSSRYRNDLDPSYGDVEFERDLKACRGDESDPGTVPVGRFQRGRMHAQATLAWSCMKARGWSRTGD